jgi:hypothetical protein
MRRQSLFFQAAKILNDLSAANGDELADLAYTLIEGQEPGVKTKAWLAACARLAEILPRLRERLEERKVNETFDANGFEVYLSANGNSSVMGPDGVQDERLSVPWLLLFAELLESRGIDPTKVVFWLPDGKRARVDADAEGGLGWKAEGQGAER